MEKVRIGIVGVGHLGKLHLKNLLEIKSAECSGIYDIDNEKAKSIADEFKVKSFSNLDGLFKNSDGVIISTTTSNHFEVGKLALENNLHIFIEKPITSTVAEAEELIKLAKEKNDLFKSATLKDLIQQFYLLKNTILNQCLFNPIVYRNSIQEGLMLL